VGGPAIAAARTAGHMKSQGATKMKKTNISTGIMYAAVTDGVRRPSQADAIGAKERIVTAPMPVTAAPLANKTTKYESSQQ